MRLKMLKDSSNSLLKKDISKNLPLYSYNKYPWVDEYFKELGINEFAINTNLNINDLKLNLSSTASDAQNAIIIHEAMKNLLPIHAREEKIWVYLTHTICWNYMITRWPIKSTNSKEISRILSRYFFKGNNNKKIKIGTVPYVRNGISRLWWAGYIVYDETLDNPYEYIDELFLSQDLFVGLCERDIAKNKRLTLAILKSVRKFNLKDIPNNTTIIRSILKDINFSAGLVIYDTLDQEELENKVEEIIIKNLLKEGIINIYEPVA